MEASFDFGMIGIGVMGSNLLLNIADHGYSVVGFDLKKERADKLEAAARPNTIVRGTIELTEMIALLKRPRKIMMLVPAGKPVDDVIENVLPHLEEGDILIDGGNSYFKDTNKRINYLQDKKIHFFGMGVSGGEMGARLGPSMMPGGDRDAYQYLKPILESIAAKSGEDVCVAYMGNNSAGHYVKMVHNGIEYSMMQMISEAYDLLHRGGAYTNDELYASFKRWNEGQLQSFLIEITAEIFKTSDNETPDPHDFLLDKILDQAGSKGTGKWTSQEAMDLPISIPSIDMAVAMRDLSVYKSERVAAAKLYNQELPKFQVTNDILSQLENALAFSFAIAYAQGLSMLAKASEIYKMDIPLPDVVKVWKAGCIIRSALLGNFTDAYKRNPKLSNLLLDQDLSQLLKNREDSIRDIVKLAVDSKIPLNAMGSALGYYDAYLSDRMPVNLIQAQRDFFGAHTYQRIDMDGVFHTEWATEGEQSNN